MNVDRLPEELPESSVMGCMCMVRMEPQPIADPAIVFESTGTDGEYYAILGALCDGVFDRPACLGDAMPRLIDGIWYWMA